MSKRKKKDRKAGATAPTPPVPPPVIRTERETTRVAAPRVQQRATAAPVSAGPKRPLTFGRDTYIWLGIGFGLVVLGLLLMTGGRGDDPTVFDEDVIYSFRKITLAPVVILSGLGAVFYAILKK